MYTNVQVQKLYRKYLIFIIKIFLTDFFFYDYYFLYTNNQLYKIDFF